MRPIHNYLKLLTGDTINLTSGSSDLGSENPEELKQFYTCDPIFRSDCNKAVLAVKSHFSSNPDRPLNSLVLGAPGSGKSFLAKEIGNACNADYLEYNISQMTTPKEIISSFDEISRVSNGKGTRRLVVLIDEFDVKVGGGSAVQYLISPIYDRYDLRNVAFIFSGSYVKNREMLGAGLNNAQKFDFFRFLVDYRVYLGAGFSSQSAELQNYIDLISVLEQRASDHPDRNILDYLRSLEKLIDFRSRINGFTVEIPAIDSPLDLTQDRFQLMGTSEGIIWPTEAAASKIVSYVEAIEGSDKYGLELNDPWHIFASYEDSILRERLSRLGLMIKRRYCKEGGNLRISRGVLNYLVVAPLFHGMRSLEFLINQLSVNGKKNPVISWTAGVSDERLAMHIRDYHEFNDWVGIWNNMLATNRFKSTSGVNEIVISV